MKTKIYIATMDVDLPQGSQVELTGRRGAGPLVEIRYGDYVKMAHEDNLR